MKSSGGVTGAATIRREPVRPPVGAAAGALGAAFIGVAAGFKT